jgi:arsenate reductase (thioredoxin)
MSDDDKQAPQERQEKRRVLFLCTGNSARSQMAEGLLRHLGGGHFESLSAGTAPKKEVHPLAVRAMAELGIDIGAQRPKDLARYLSEKFDFIITVCDRARDACPVFPGDHEQIHWSFEDPAATTGTEDERLQTFRRIRSEIQQRVRLFVGAQTGTRA